MKILKDLAIIFFCLFLGEIVRIYVDFPIPPVVYGMLFLLIFLLLKVVKVKDVLLVSNVFLGNLAFLFLPLTVMLMDQMDVLGKYILPIFVIIMVSLVLTMAVTAKVVQLCQNARKKNE